MGESKEEVVSMLKEHTEKLKEAIGEMTAYYEQVAQVIRQLKEAFAAGKRVYVVGNGGSASQAQHLAGEFVGRYRGNRRAYPMVALTADTATLTCIGNDFGYENIFKRQVEALGQEGDILIGLTTSGTSANVLRAAEAAREMGMTIIALTGRHGTFKEMADFTIESPSDKAAVIQELHLHAIHLICEAFEED